MAPIRVGVHIAMPIYMEVLGGKNLADFEFLTAAGNDMLNHLTWWVDALSTARAKAA